MDANHAWEKLIFDIVNKGKRVRVRGLDCVELLSYTSRIDMTRCITTTRPKIGYRFMAAEAWWILSGRNDVKSIAPFSKAISSFSNDGRRFDGAYGPKIVDQLRYVVDTLNNDTFSRQAVIEIWRPNPRDSKDVPCTISVQFMIRHDEDGQLRLYCFDSMRSSDAWLGWPYDVFNFSMLSAYILLSLREKDKIELGDLYLTAASQHLYVDPLANGNANIPYTLAQAVKWSSLADKPKTKTYVSFSLRDFLSPDDLVNHLQKVSIQAVGQGPQWMEDLFK